LLLPLVFGVLAPVTQVSGAPVADEPHRFQEKDVRRAERVLAKLRPLDEAAARDDMAAFRALAGGLFPGLFVTVAEMRPSDLKTDLGTAVFLYEAVARRWHSAGPAADCRAERPNLYRPLCLGLRSGTVRELILAKARLHLSWVGAVVNNYRGACGAETSALLSAMRAAREADAIIAERVLETLKTLGEFVKAYQRCAESMGCPRAAGGEFEELEEKIDEALKTSGALLASMPRSATFYHLSDARLSYKDGLFWLRKVSQSGKMEMVVSASGFAPDPLKDLRLGAEQVGSTVTANWRNAAKYTRLAEQSMPAANTR
jgi:hypothetical protein